MKQLIINADDFGLSAGVNRAVIKGWREGILTSASLMVGAPAFADAVDLARENPGLQVGLHLTLVQGRSVVAHNGFPCLTEREGKFPGDPVMAGMRMFFLKPLHRQIQAEVEGQITRFLGTGLPLSHIDGHLNIHMHPTVFAILCKLMPKYGIDTFRLSRERLGPELRISSGRLLGKVVDAVIFGLLAGRCQPELQMRRIGFAREVKGLLNSGRMTEEYLLAALDLLQDGMTEIYFHPGDADEAELAATMPDYRHRDELAALLSPRVMEKLGTLGITLRNYRGDVKSQ
ncbi:MAG TPA: hopanoid biosynthesis-associated protein HpnK [Geobacteraceae bacterium]|nr:hopanoid biosynthesis-associated protein HpnK [Geobacteraceae bacterium]